MTRATRVFTPKVPPAAPATSVNRDGFPAYERPIEEQWLQTLLTNTIGNTYYATKQELLQEAHQVHDAMLATGDWGFVGQGLAYARKRGFMRLQPILGLVKVAQMAKDGSVADGWRRNAALVFAQAFPEVVQTPNDLLDFMAVLKGVRGNEGGRLVKRVAGRWLASKFGPTSGVSSYWAIKYGAEKTQGYSLADALRLYHPKGGWNAVMAYLNGPRLSEAKQPDVEGWLAAAAAVPQLAAFQGLKDAKTDEDKVAYITEGRLPHEVATPFAGKSKDVWKAIAAQMPVFATLRHLATFERQGVLDDVREVVEKKLTDPQTIAKSRILPFRFLEAADHVGSTWAQDALRDALELSFRNVPEIRGTTAIMLDVSGSMAGDTVQKAAIFAICAAKKAQDRVRFMTFNTGVSEVPVSRRDSILTQVARLHADGGTDTGAAIRKLTLEKAKFDNLLIVTDEQQNTGSAFVQVFLTYLRDVNRRAKAFVLDVQPYRNAMTPSLPGVFYVSGWSDQALAYVSMASGDGFAGMAEAVRKGEWRQRDGQDNLQEGGMQADAAPAGGEA